jgi:mgtE-like transporter
MSVGGTDRGVREVVVDAYRGALPTLAVSAVGGLLAGVVLGGMEAELAAVEGLLVLVPAFLAIRGSVYGSLGSRLSSALHQGLVDPANPDRRLLSASVAALCNGILASLFAAALTVGALTVLGRAVAPLGTFLVVAFVGGFLAGVALTVVVVGVVLAGYRRGLDPDDLVGPAVTTAGDVFGLLALLVAVRVALAL